MPTTLLEAMAFGLPVISRPVGGLKDFFENGRMGFLIDSTDPLDYVEKIDSLISDPDLTMRISEYNSEYARSNFMASKIAPDLESKLANIRK